MKFRGFARTLEEMDLKRAAEWGSACKGAIEIATRLDTPNEVANIYIDIAAKAAEGAASAAHGAERIREQIR